MAEKTVDLGVYQLRVVGTIEGQLYNNVIHLQSVGANHDIIEDLLIVMWICFVEQLVPHMGSKFVLVKMTAKRVAPDVGPEWEYTGTGSETLTGAAEGDTVPSFVSVRTSIRCERGGRSGRGAISIAGIPEIATDGSAIVTTSDFWTHLQSWLECVRTHFLKGWGLGNKLFYIGVVSRKGTFADKPPFTTEQFSPAVSMRIEPHVGSQISRKVGHGA